MQRGLGGRRRHVEQEHGPFEGRKVRGWPVATIVGGHLAYADGQVRGTPRGRFLPR
ncbi:hypothetical protein GCM10010168_91740 [Actinoplanes ianthinogenes]|uniref:Dihydroorotase n=1 Tax=Actinoplanes ianthinogenes TaxID=122358 RepID=A0ABM7LNK0_9ACTN|nr:hypothetical protein Aiant_14590 [Actinoplanes ianthinogenes]GGR58475.1 hypothetical protein GCM10010168_91740 [Actinoplanes ianthinogenes]